MLLEDDLDALGRDQLAGDRHREVGLSRARVPQEQQTLVDVGKQSDPFACNPQRLLVALALGLEVVERAVLVPTRDSRCGQQALGTQLALAAAARGRQHAVVVVLYRESRSAADWTIARHGLLGRRP